MEALIESVVFASSHDIVPYPQKRDNTYMPKASRTTQKPRELNEKTWNAQAGHPLQSWQWGRFREHMGISLVRHNGWQLTFHRIPHTGWTVGYFPKGPRPTPAMLEQLKKIGREQKAIFIQLEPDVIAQSHRPFSGMRDLVPSHHPLFTKYTFVFDLTKSEDALLAAMHSKTRYNLRIAQKHGVTVQEDNSDEAFGEYLRLSQETTGRQGFYAHDAHYHEAMWSTMKKAGIAHLFTAKYQEKTLAAWIIFSWKKTLYYPYGASSRDHREVMAPTLMLWEIAKWGKAHGYLSFDLWGALGPSPKTGEPDPHDPWYGFHRFKQGFNPTLVAYAGSFDLILRPFLYKLYTWADTIRWILLKKKTDK